MQNDLIRYKLALAREKALHAVQAIEQEINDLTEISGAVADPGRYEEIGKAFEEVGANVKVAWKGRF